MYTPQCPRCGKLMKPDQRIHWACFRARLWQVTRFPLLITIIIAAIIGGSIMTLDPIASDSLSVDDPPAQSTVMPQPGETVTLPPAATNTPEPPVLVRFITAAGQLYDQPGLLSDITMTRTDILVVQSQTEVAGELWYAVSNEAYGGERYVRADQVEPLP